MDVVLSLFEMFTSNFFPCSLYNSMTSGETNGNICGEKGSAHGLRRVQDFVVLNYQLLPEKSKEHPCKLQLQEVSAWGSEF